MFVRALDTDGLVPEFFAKSVYALEKGERLTGYTSLSLKDQTIRPDTSHKQ